MYSGTVTYHPHLGSSDHIGLVLKLKVSLRVPSPLTSQWIYHWNSAPWSHIHGRFRRVQWDVLRSGTVSDAAEAFATIIIKARDCYIPSTVPVVARPTVWWNRFCQRTYQRKVQCWANHDWPGYHAAVSAAKKAQAIAFRHHRNSLLYKLQI